MKQYFGKLLWAALAASAVLAGCGQGGDGKPAAASGASGATPAAAAPAGDKKVTLAVWGSSPAEIAALDATIADFTAKTGITVEKEIIQDKYMDVLKARFAGSNAPDVFYLDALEAPGFIKSGVLLDQTASVPNQSDFYEPLVNSFKVDGKLYAAPKDYSTLSTYVNLDLLSKVGGSVEKLPKDMPGLLAFAKDAKGKLPKGSVPLLLEKSLARHLSAMEATGDQVIAADGKANFANSTNINGYLKSLVGAKKDGVAAFSKEDLGIDWSGAAFGAGKALFMFEGNWALGAMKKDYASLKYTTLEMPTVNNKPHTMTFTVGYAISAKTARKDNAIAFVNYMTGEGQAKWTTGSGTLPTRKSVSAATQVEADPLKKSHIMGASYGTVWSRGASLPVIDTAFGNQFQSAMTGAASVEQAMQKVDKEANDEIERQK